MKVYPVFNDMGARVPIFEIENVYVSVSTVAKLLKQSEGVTEVRVRRAFRDPGDVHVLFRFLGRAYIVLEPWGDNSRYWIGPADMVRGFDAVLPLPNVSDISKLEVTFENYRPPLHRAIVGDLLTLKFIKR